MGNARLSASRPCPLPLSFQHVRGVQSASEIERVRGRRDERLRLRNMFPEGRLFSCAKCWLFGQKCLRKRQSDELFKLLFFYAMPCMQWHASAFSKRAKEAEGGEERREVEILLQR